MSESIWVIEQGEYSDYLVVGVFSSKENAMVVCKAINGDKGGGFYPATVAKWVLDPGVEDLNAGRNVYLVHMLRDGNVEKLEMKEFSGFDLDAEPHIWRRSSVPYWHGKGAKDCLCATVFADDDRHAVKIVNEKRAQMIAMGQWPEDGK